MLNILVFLFSSQFVVAQVANEFDPSRCNQIFSETYFLGDSNVGCCPGYVPRMQNGVKICSRNGAGVQQTQNDNGGSEVNSADAVIQQCVQATDSAKENCNFDSSPATKSVLAIASGLKQQLNTQAATGGQAYLCSQMGSLAQAIDGAVAAYSGYCSAGFAKCSETCSSSVKEVENLRSVAVDPAVKQTISDKLTDLRKTQRECNSLSQNIQNVAENISNYTQLEKMKAQTCGKQLGNAQNQICQANPLAPGCQQKLSTDCSDPAVAAANTICICQRNPTDSRCGGSTGSFASSSMMNGGAGAAGGGGADGALGNFGGMGGDFPDGAGFEGNSKPGAAENGSLLKGASGKASLDMGGGGTGGAGPNGRGGGAGSGINTKIIGGYGFGSGGGYGGGYGSTSGQPGSGYAGRYGRGGVGPNGKPVDLRQFMPGGRMDPSRALAGVSGPDGITGPNSDIWKKIRVRYYAVSPTLLP